MAVTPHHLSTAAATTILFQGGNAVDAAIAANAVQGVVAPETCGIGGDLFALVLGLNDPEPITLNSSGRAGSRAAELADDLRTAGVTEIPQDHPAAVTVPGCVDGWLALNERFGRLDLATVLTPAIRLARGGFAANQELAAAFAARREQFSAAAPEMYPDGQPPLASARIQRPTLARTLERIAAEGRDALYSGEVGRAISEALDGSLSPDDLGRSQAEWVDPLSAEVLGMTGWTIPPNSQGYISLLSLAVLEAIGVPEPEDPSLWHAVIESYRLAAADRDDVLADPESIEISAVDLLGDTRVASLADRYDPNRATDPTSPPPAAGGTAYMTVLDGEGLGISLIQSNFHGIGSGFAVPAGGFILHDRGRGFDLRPGHPNELSPGRRPLHTLSPTVWRDASGSTSLLGTRGGFMQPQLIVQMAVSAFGFGLEPSISQASPRWMVPLPGPTQSSVEVEPGTPEDVIEALEERGHAVHRHEIPQAGWGPVSVIRSRPDGLARGAADPRVDTASAAGL